MRKVTTEQKNWVLKERYHLQHQKLNNAVIKELNEQGTALVVDCYSFPSIPNQRVLSQDRNTPVYNIGTVIFHTPQKLIDFSKEYFESFGYSLGIDTPYSGALVPMEHYQKNKKCKPSCPKSIENYT